MDNIRIDGEIYEMIDRNCETISTPFGDLFVKINNRKTSFLLAKKNYNINGKNELNADVYGIAIETKNLNLNDKIDVQLDSNEPLEFCSSGERRYMLSVKNNKFVLAMVGYDSDYSHELGFYNGEYYSYAMINDSRNGLLYEILKNPNEHLEIDVGHIIYVWIAWLPSNPKYDLEEELSIQLA